MFRLCPSVSRSLGSSLLVVRELALDGFRFLKAAVRSRSAASAEILFLRKQLAFYQEHQIRPRRLTDAARFFPGLLVSALRLEGSVGDRQAGDFDRLASQVVQTVLEVEVPSGQTATAREYPATDRSHGPRKSNLGRRTSGRRIVGETSGLSFAANGAVLLAFAVLPQRHEENFVSALEDVRPQPRHIDRGM
jgi:hypothetical protein